MASEALKLMPRELEEVLGVETHDIVAQFLGIETQGEADWNQIALALLQRRAMLVGIVDNEVFLWSPEVALDEIESKYLENARQYFEIEDTSSGWEYVKQVYDQGKESLGREELEIEDLRYQVAKALQLNKFLATWDEIAAEFRELGVFGGGGGS